MPGPVWEKSPSEGRQPWEDPSPSTTGPGEEVGEGAEVGAGGGSRQGPPGHTGYCVLVPPCVFPE